MTPYCLAGAWVVADKRHPDTVAAYARVQSRPVALSIFDLDRTLTIWPTYTPFLLFAARTRAPWRLLIAPMLLPFALLYAMNIVSRRTMKEVMHRAALGAALPEHDAARLCERFARLLVTRGLHAEGLAVIDAERRAGRRVVLATAAPHIYAAALARRLGIADVIATPSSWRGGCLVPAISMANCYGTDKRHRIEIFLQQAGIARPNAHIRFYSDHVSDLPTFDFADEAVAVNPSKELRKIAARRGWPMLDWRVSRR